MKLYHYLHYLEAFPWLGTPPNFAGLAALETCLVAALLGEDAVFAETAGFDLAIKILFLG